MSAENIKYIADIISISQIFLVVLILWQVILLNKQIKSDHERSRKEKAVEVLYQWNTNLKEDNSIARKIVESLDKKEAINLWNQKSIKIDLEFGNSIATLLGIKEDELTIDNELISLTEIQSEKLRWHTVTFLNSLEVALIAWQYSIADKDIMEKQLSFLFSVRDDHEALKDFRNASGGDGYPAIEAFSRHIKEKKNKQPTKTDNIA